MLQITRMASYLIYMQMKSRGITYQAISSVMLECKFSSRIRGKYFTESRRDGADLLSLK